MALTQVPSSMLANSGAELGMRNRIINGDMRIDQRNAGASVTPTSSTYTVDRWTTNLTQPSKFSIQQNAGSVTPPSGYTNYLGVTSLSSYSVVSSDFFALLQNIEGLNVYDLGFGTANASSVTVSFWVRSSLTGTFGGSLTNSAINRSYPFSYSINSANTWEQKYITVAGDTSGTWLKDNGVGLRVYFNLGAGSTYSGTAGAWAAAAYTAPTGATSVVGTSGATFYITGVQLEVGSNATPFERRLYGQELALCQRYYAALGAGATGYIFSATNADVAVQFPVTMRTTPTVTHLANYTIVCVATGTYTVTATIVNSSVAGTNTTGMGLRLTSSGMTVGNAWLTNGNNIGFSAEL